jgi:hypothetical protein
MPSVRYLHQSVSLNMGSIPIVQIHFLVGQASCLSKLKGGQDAHSTRNYFCKNGMHPEDVALGLSFDTN